MKTIERTITVATPLSRVWEYLSDFTNTEEWDPPTVSTVRESGDGGVGTVYRNVSKVLGREVPITYTVTKHVPERELQLRGETGSMHMLDTMTFDGDDQRTTVTYRAEFQPEGAAKLAEPLLPLGLERLGDKSQEQMKRCLTALGDRPPS